MGLTAHDVMDTRFFTLTPRFPASIQKLAGYSQGLPYPLRMPFIL